MHSFSAGGSAASLLRQYRIRASAQGPLSVTGASGRLCKRPSSHRRSALLAEYGSRPWFLCVLGAEGGIRSLARCIAGSLSSRTLGPHVGSTDCPSADCAGRLFRTAKFPCALRPLHLESPANLRPQRLRASGKTHLGTRPESRERCSPAITNLNRPYHDFQTRAGVLVLDNASDPCRYPRWPRRFSHHRMCHQQHIDFFHASGDANKQRGEGSILSGAVSCLLWLANSVLRHPISPHCFAST
ncbi:hypothetical protein BDW22DRAFT_733175 [Trametopsis cervina]|nr:hypothetical protein BDW22DRAFT_733175 [Trametopsis cervina]